MKTRMLFGIIALLLIGCLASKKINYDEPRKVAKQKLVPPGTVWLRDSTFVDITEVRNLDYLEFLYWTSRLDPANYGAMLPDTTCWSTSDLATGPYKEYYLRHPAYWDYPVVGISYEQALAFCAWRTKVVNNYYYIMNHGGWKKFPGDTIGKLNTPLYVEYRLPTREEWEYASAAGLSYPGFEYGYVSLSGKDNLPVSNTAESKFMRAHTVNGTSNEGCVLMVDGDPVQPVMTGSANRYGIYHLLGNVSEIIQDSCFKGLNFETTLDGATMKSNPEKYQRTDSIKGDYDYHFTFRYKKPDGWLGFRCVCVVKQIP